MTFFFQLWPLLVSIIGQQAGRDRRTLIIRCPDCYYNNRQNHLLRLILIGERFFHGFQIIRRTHTADVFHGFFKQYSTQKKIVHTTYSVCLGRKNIIRTFNPCSSTAVPFWGQTSQLLGSLFSKRDCSTKKRSSPLGLLLLLLQAILFWRRKLLLLTRYLVCPHKTGDWLLQLRVLRGTLVNRTYGTHKKPTRYLVPGMYLTIFTNNIIWSY